MLHTCTYGSLLYSGSVASRRYRKFCAWCLSEFCWKDEKTPEGKIGETIMMAPAAGFYSTPGMGMNQVRLAYVLNKKDIQRALFLLEKALEQYNKEITK